MAFLLANSNSIAQGQDKTESLFDSLEYARNVPNLSLGRARFFSFIGQCPKTIQPVLELAWFTKALSDTLLTKRAEVEALFPKLNNRVHEGLAHMILAQAYCVSYGPNDNLEKAQYHGQEARKLLEDQDILMYKYQVLKSFGVVAYQRRQIDELIQYTLEALKLARQFPATQAHWQAGDLYTLGIVEVEQGDAKIREKRAGAHHLAKAQGYLKKSLLILKSFPLLRAKRIRVERVLATCFDIQNRTKDAEKIYRRMLNERELLENDATQSATIHWFLGRNLAHQRRPKEALHYLRLAHDLAVAAKNESSRRGILTEMAGSLDQLGQSKAAYDTLLASYNRHIAMLDQIQNEELSKANARFKNELLAKENDLQQAQLKEANAKRNALVGLVVGVIILAAFGLWFWTDRSKQKNKAERLLQEKTLQIQAEFKLKQERERISRDLHDNVGAHLSQLVSGLAEMENQTAQPLVSELTDISRSSIALLRETIWALNQEQISLSDFAFKLSQFARQQFRHQADVVIQVENQWGQSNLSLGPEAALHLFRMSQEVLHNAQKYARASQIILKFLLVGDRAEISISDNGKGFEKEQMQGAGFGLANLQNRAKEAGFELTIQSEPERGSLILIGFQPLANGANAV